MLTHGSAHYRIPVFLNELIRDVSALLNSVQINEVMSALKVIHSEKLKAERGPTKKKGAKPQLKGISKRGDALGMLDDDVIEDDEYGEFDDFL